MKKAVKMLLAVVVGMVIGWDMCFAKSPAGDLVFMKEKYRLAYSVSEGDGIWLNEYLRPSEKLDSYTKMLALRTYGNLNLPAKDAAINVARNLKASNPKAQFALHENEKTGEVLLDFLTWNQSVEEFNVFKFGQVGGKLVSLQFVFRTFQSVDQMKQFMQTQRIEVLQHMTQMPFPAPQTVTKIK